MHATSEIQDSSSFFVYVKDMDHVSNNRFYTYTHQILPIVENTFSSAGIFNANTKKLKL